MKTVPLVIVFALMLAACATPKYSYNFDYYNYNSGKKAKASEKVVVAGVSRPESVPEPLEVSEEDIIESPLIHVDEPVASSDNGVSDADVTVPVMDKIAFEKKYSEMSKSERKGFKKALKSEIRNLVNSNKDDNGASVDEAKAMDHDLKMALIFGAVALTLSFFGGVNSIFWILSVVSLVVAVVFFIKWIAEQ